MPLRNLTDELITARAEIPHFSALAQTKASAARNIVNAEELRQWLRELLESRFGASPEPTEPQRPNDRRAACERWTQSVARKWMLREGQTESHEPIGEALERSPAWVQTAIAEGNPPQRLALAPIEREALAGALDWMRSDDGPALGSDWSRISVEQAIAAEKKWIEALAKAALKKDLDAADAAGTSLFAESPATGPDGRSGWRWVQVRSKEALDREGALMKHCAGSYADDVALDRKSIFSLRDPDNKPRLTLETQKGKIAQLKALANQACPPELFARVADFAHAFADLCQANNWPIKVSDETEAAGVFSLPGLGIAIAGAPPKEFAARVASEIGQGQLASVEALPTLAALGWIDLVELALPHASEALRSEALAKAAERGQLLCVKLLLPVSDPKANASLALARAAKNGHRELVELLLPLSDPKANGSRALREAIDGNHPEIFKLLLPLSDFYNRDGSLLELAARKGHREVLEPLLAASAPDIDKYYAVNSAAIHGYREVIELLLPDARSKADYSFALGVAARNDRLPIVELMLPFCDADERSKALKEAKKYNLPEIASLIQNAIDAPAPLLPPILGAIGPRLAQTRQLEPLAARREARPDPRRAG